MKREVMDPPRDGDEKAARFILKDDWEVVGWTNSPETAADWLSGFGPVTTANVVDRRPAKVRTKARV